MQWIDINKQLPSTTTDEGILALYMPIIDLQNSNGDIIAVRAHDFTQAHLNLDNNVVILWRDLRYSFWFVGGQSNIKFTEQNIKEYIGWWFPISMVNSPQKDSTEYKLFEFPVLREK